MLGIKNTYSNLRSRRECKDTRNQDIYDTGYRVRYEKYSKQNTGCKTNSSKHIDIRIQSTGYILYCTRIKDTGYRIDETV